VAFRQIDIKLKINPEPPGSDPTVFGSYINLRSAPSAFVEIL